MIATYRKFLKQRMSPRSFQYVRSCWWHGRYYVPRSLASAFIKRTPRVTGFPAGQTSDLVHRLRNVNALAPTGMCRVMTKYESDKGQGWHNYTTIYSALFGELCDKPVRIFELGLGTDNPNLASTMRANGRPGASLRGWRELFPHAAVYGADIDRDILFEEDRIKTFYCDQLDSLAIRDLWAHGELRDAFDIIIDDGLHTFEANTSFLEGSIEHLRPGGFFVIEDILRDALERWRERLETVYSRRFPDHEFVLLELPNSANTYDNNMLVIRQDVLASA